MSEKLFRRVSDLNKKTLKQWSKISADITKRIEDRSLSTSLNDSFFTYTEADTLRAFSDMTKESAIRNIIINNIISCESKSPGAGFVFLKNLAGEKSEHSKGKRLQVFHLSNGIKKMTDEFTSDIVIDSIKIAGRKGKIILDKGDFRSTEITHGTQTCRWKPENSFFMSLGSTRLDVQNCAVIFIDGIIETVSECHKILNDSYEKKIPVVMFARGFSEEVIATTALNVKRKTAIVVPVLIPFDEVGVNSFADLAKCFGVDAISSDKGQLISSVNLDNTKAKVDRMVFTPNFTEIDYKDNKTEQVIAYLSSKLSSDENQSFLIRKRIEAIGSGIVTIKIGNDKKSMIGITRDRIDFGLRFANECMKTGIVENNGYIFPASAVKIANDSLKSFVELISKCSNVLEVDNVE